MPERFATAWWRWLALSAIVVALDLATKAWVSSVFQYGESKYILPFFNLVLAHNTGAAFSFLAGAGGWQRWFFTVVTVAISIAILVMMRRHSAHRVFCAALGLVLGGAIGNLYDRVTLGYVVDFIQVHGGGYYFPAFNAADSAITVGVAILIWDSIFGAEAKAARREAAAAPLPEEKR